MSLHRFSQPVAKSLRRRQGRPGDTRFMDEVFIKIGCELHYLWRTVDKDGDVIDIPVQRRRDAQAARRFFAQVLKGQGAGPNRITTDKLRSYVPAVQHVLPEAMHDTRRCANNRGELSHKPTRQRERRMRWFKSQYQAQLFLALHARVNNLFRYGRHLLRAANHRLFRARAFVTWRQVKCI